MMWESQDIKVFLSEIAAVMRDNKDRLIELDSVMGDGDLGLTMSDGFTAAANAISPSEETDLGKLLYAAGKAMSSAVPSSMGTLMASGLMSAGKALKGKTQADHAGIAAILRGWYDGVLKLGKAQPGEKTFLDGLLPAVEALETGAGEENFAAVITRAHDAAKTGAQSTVGMLAKHGRAAIRGEESRKLLDPGAVVASLILEAMERRSA